MFSTCFLCWKSLMDSFWQKGCEICTFYPSPMLHEYIGSSLRQKPPLHLSLVLVIGKVVMGVISPHFFWYSLEKKRKFGTSSHKFQPNFSIFCTLHTSSLQCIRLKWATNFSLFESPRLKRAPNLSKFHCTTEGDFPHHYKEKLVRNFQNIFSTN